MSCGCLEMPRSSIDATTAPPPLARRLPRSRISRRLRMPHLSLALPGLTRAASLASSAVRLSPRCRPAAPPPRRMEHVALWQLLHICATPHLCSLLSVRAHRVRPLQQLPSRPSLGAHLHGGSRSAAGHRGIRPQCSDAFGLSDLSTHQKVPRIVHPGIEVAARRRQGSRRRWRPPEFPSIYISRHNTIL